MLTLIIREIYDNIAYFFGAIILSLLIAAIVIFIAYYTSDTGEAVVALISVFSIPLIIIFMLGTMAMGVSQMYMDRSRKVTSFLSTLAVTRDKILIARISAGILAILIFFIPLIIVTVILCQLFMPPIPIYEGVFFDVTFIAVLFALASYCIGLQTGWTTGRLFPMLGGLLLACTFITIIIIKGFELQLSILLILFIAASLVRIRDKFITTSL
jgi:hypothetical protein